MFYENVPRKMITFPNQNKCVIPDKAASYHLVPITENTDLHFNWFLLLGCNIYRNNLEIYSVCDVHCTVGKAIHPNHPEITLKHMELMHQNNYIQQNRIVIRLKPV